jgi:DNA-binding response OmpR family regulator
MVQATGKTKLLIVDDDAPIRKLLERVALRAGFDVDCAKDGLDAFEMILRKQYDIAIIDLMMPRMSGYDLVQKVSTLNPRPAIIVATALTNGDVSKIDDSLVRRVIRKPFDVESVAETLIETARQIADQQAAAASAVPVAPPEAAIIRVSAEDIVRQSTEPSMEEKQKSEDAVNPKPKRKSKNSHPR